MNLLILVGDDEPDVEVLFRQQFRRDLRADRFEMEFAQAALMALQRIADAGDRSLILILSDINMPGMSGLELLPKAKAMRPDVPIIMITAYGDAETKRKALENGAEALPTKPIDFWHAAQRDRYAGRTRRVAKLPDIVAVREAVYDVVDGSSTGTTVPRMWALIKAPTIRRSYPCKRLLRSVWTLRSLFSSSRRRCRGQCCYPPAAQTTLRPGVL